MRAVSISTLGALLTVGIALIPQASIAAPADVPPEVVASREAVQKFSATLKEALQEAVKSGGPVNGIAVCHDQAGRIAADLGQPLGMTVGRTSLKVRNAANAADDWELVVLEQFEARKTQGEPADKLEFFEVTDDQGQKTFRYMKAIPTAALCLNCHGENLKPEVDAKLKELYPNDQARGFKEGDLRGAFTLTKPAS